MADYEAMETEIDWSIVWTHSLRMATAYVLALPIAWNRERASRSAGLRTFPLVAIASCGYMLVGMQVLSDTNAEARVIQGLITGIGFIGGGAILKSGGSVTGTATAASLWNTGVIGMSVAWNRLEVAVVLSAINFLTLQFLAPLKGAVATDDDAESD